MIVIRYIMAVAVHGPEKVFLEAVRMPMVRDHIQMILNGLENCG